jgi:hypothetical protein
MASLGMSLQTKYSPLLNVKISIRPGRPSLSLTLVACPLGETLELSHGKCQPHDGLHALRAGVENQGRSGRSVDAACPLCKTMLEAVTAEYQQPVYHTPGGTHNSGGDIHRRIPLLRQMQIS